MLRRLLNITSITCLVLCVALMGLWVRSFVWWDQCHGRLTNTEFFRIGTIPGRLVFGTVIDMPVENFPWSISSMAIDGRKLFDNSVEHRCSASHLGFGLNSSMVGTIVVIPFWFSVLLSGSLALAFQLRWPLRFTLRSLFIATTFLAVVLGMSAWLDRAWIGK
jgi:hypothetical protein